MQIKSEIKFHRSVDLKVTNRSVIELKKQSNMKIAILTIICLILCLGFSEAGSTYPYKKRPINLTHFRSALRSQRLRNEMQGK